MTTTFLELEAETVYDLESDGGLEAEAAFVIQNLRGHPVMISEQDEEPTDISDTPLFIIPSGEVWSAKLPDVGSIFVWSLRDGLVTIEAT